MAVAVATIQEYRAILMPPEPYKQLKIREYLKFGKKKKLFKGECIRTVSRDVHDPYFFYIEEGEIATEFESESGNRVSTVWWGTGSVILSEFNDFASIGRYKMRFRAMENTVLFSFSQQQLYEIMLVDPGIFYDYIYICHMTFAQNFHRLGNTGQQTSAQRLAMWLQKLCAIQKPESDGSYQIKCTMTLRQIAEYLFIHITTCNKLFLAMEEEGILKRSRTRIRIIDLEKLKNYGFI